MIYPTVLALVSSASASVSGEANYAYYIIQQLPTHPTDEMRVAGLGQVLGQDAPRYR